MAIARRSRRTEVNIWPAFVDALGQLVIAIIFLLLIFTVAQFLTTDALSGRDQALQRLTQQINELTDLLNLEKRSNEDLRLNVAQLSAELQNSSAAKDGIPSSVCNKPLSRRYTLGDFTCRFFRFSCHGESCLIIKNPVRISRYFRTVCMLTLMEPASSAPFQIPP